MGQQAKNSEEKAKKAMVDAARLADELKAEQDHTRGQDKAKRALECQLSEMEHKCADANENAIRGGRNAMAKLETRIRELETELGSAQPRSSRTRNRSRRPRRSPPSTWPSSARHSRNWRRPRREQGLLRPGSASKRVSGLN